MNFEEFCRVNNITIVYTNLKGRVRGFCTYIDNQYVVVVDSRLSYSQQKKTLMHELIHIFSNHLESDCEIYECEKEVKQIIKELRIEYDSI